MDMLLKLQSTAFPSTEISFKIFFVHFSRSAGIVFDALDNVKFVSKVQLVEKTVTIYGSMELCQHLNNLSASSPRLVSLRKLFALQAEI